MVEPLADQFAERVVHRVRDQVRADVEVAHEPAQHQRVGERHRGPREQAQREEQRDRKRSDRRMRGDLRRRDGGRTPRARAQDRQRMPLPRSMPRRRDSPERGHATAEPSSTGSRGRLYRGWDPRKTRGPPPMRAVRDNGIRYRDNACFVTGAAPAAGTRVAAARSHRMLDVLAITISDLPRRAGRIRGDASRAVREGRHARVRQVRRHFALPALLFNALSQHPIGDVLNGGYVLAYLAARWRSSAPVMPGATASRDWIRRAAAS